MASNPQMDREGGEHTLPGEPRALTNITFPVRTRVTQADSSSGSDGLMSCLQVGGVRIILQSQTGAGQKETSWSKGKDI